MIYINTKPCTTQRAHTLTIRFVSSYNTGCVSGIIFCRSHCVRTLNITPGCPAGNLGKVTYARRTNPSMATPSMCTCGWNAKIGCALTDSGTY